MSEYSVLGIFWLYEEPTMVAVAPPLNRHTFNDLHILPSETRKQFTYFVHYWVYYIVSVAPLMSPQQISSQAKTCTSAYCWAVFTWL